MRRLILFAILLMPTAAAAELSYQHLGIEHESIDYAYLGARADGLAATASMVLPGHTFLTLRYGRARTDSFVSGVVRGRIHATEFTAGLGSWLALGANWHLVPSVHYLREVARYLEGFSSNRVRRSDGYAAQLMTRLALTGRLELAAGYRYARIWERDDNSLLADLQWRILAGHAIGLRYNHTDIGADYRASPADTYQVWSVYLQRELD